MSTSADGTIRTWNWEDGSLLHAIDPAHHSTSHRPNAVRGPAWTNLYMVTGGFRDGTLKVWNRENNALVSEYQTKHTSIGNVASGEGKVAASIRVGDGQYEVMLWDGEMINTEGL
jgi:WD40 repeat protein